jgi:hypothetical protein
MSASYWKMMAENIAKGLGQNTIRRLGVGSKFLGRASAVAGIGFLVYELFKNYKENIEAEPAYKEMVILQKEMKKWTSAISCLGREPFEASDYGSPDEGGAINALSKKRTLSGRGHIAPDPKEAFILTGRAVNYIMETENLMADNQFKEKKKALVSQLRELQIQIKGAADCGPIQNQLARIVEEIRPIESGYATRIYDCSREIQKTLGSNAAWAAVSMTTLGLVKKPARKT